MKILSCEKWFDMYENELVGGTHFHINGFKRRLVLTQAKATRKWLIELYCTIGMPHFLFFFSRKVILYNPCFTLMLKLFYCSSSGAPTEWSAIFAFGVWLLAIA